MNSIAITVFRLIEKTRKLPARAARKLFGITIHGRMLKVDCQGQAASDLIRIRLEDKTPLMISRFGRVEMDATLRFVNMQAQGSFWKKFILYLFNNSRPFWWDDDVRFMMQHNAGFIHATEENLARFATRMLNDIQEIDILGSWLSEETRLAHLFPDARILRFTDLEPYYHGNPWTQALEGKKVLVVHPFEASIRSQYARRNLLFRDVRILPEFELITLKAVQSIGGNITGFSDWFEALDWMCEQIANMDFDTAIIGAGAYGLPLAAFVKKLGKKAIHMGGATQLLFGIRGWRWDRMPFYQRLYTEYWIRPLPEDTPTNFKDIESGCYW